MEGQKNNFGSINDIKEADMFLQKRLSSNNFSDVSLMSSKEKLGFARALKSLNKGEDARSNTDIINSIISKWSLDNIK